MSKLYLVHAWLQLVLALWFGSCPDLFWRVHYKKLTVKYYCHTCYNYLQVVRYGIEDRDEVHELEFLSLLAFLAREAISLKGGVSKAKKFSPGDLQMAYAFHNKFGQGIPSKQPWGSEPGNAGTQQTSPSHLSPSHPLPAPHYRLNTSPQHASSGLGHLAHQDMGLAGQGYPSPRDYQGHGETYGGQALHQHGELAGQRLNQSARYTGHFGGGPAGQTQQERDEQRMSMLLAAADQQPRPPPPQQGFTSPDHDRKTMSSTMQLYPFGGQDRKQYPPGQAGNREVLDSSRTSGKQ